MLVFRCTKCGSPTYAGDGRMQSVAVPYDEAIELDGKTAQCANCGTVHSLTAIIPPLVTVVARRVPKYRLCPGEVYSKSDGELHYITADQLMRCYNVDILDCVVYPNGDGLIELRPRYDGDYKLCNYPG